MDITISKLAYCKMILHISKFPHAACNGVLLSKASKETDTDNPAPVEFVDSIPLFHSGLSLAPSLEVALWKVRHNQRCRHVPKF